MRKEQIKKLEERLKQELAETEKDLASVGRINPNNPDDWEPIPEEMDVSPADENEVADSIESYEENSAILKQLELKYNELKVALDKIAKGTYGKCEVCGKEIEIERLEANPAAKTCKKDIER
jgi:RNA polymerase-binding transcription factor DksA